MTNKPCKQSIKRSVVPVSMTKLRLLHSYWSKKKQNNAFPARKDIDPIDFHYALGDVSLIDVEQNDTKGNPQFKVRLLGTNIQARIGHAFTNKDLDEFPEKDSLNKMRIAYKTVLKTREPVAYPSFFKVAEEFPPFICCIWPLSSDGQNIDMLLCCRERVTNEPLSTDKFGLDSQHSTWPYQNWPENQLLQHIVH